MHSNCRLAKASRQMVSRLQQKFSACKPSWSANSAKLNRSALFDCCVYGYPISVSGQDARTSVRRQPPTCSSINALCAP